MAVIEIRGLSKRYGEDKGVFDLNLDIGEGEVYGYLGPNGAGKTTTIRHLMGLLNPDRGSCRIRGLDCRHEQPKIQRLLGYLPGEIAFFDDMTGSQFLRFKASMRKMQRPPREDEMLSRFQLDPSGRIRRMSKGMKQKLGLVTAFMHDPEILILDEPTSGLDPLMQAAFVQLIRDEKRQGKTILMSSHSFEEVEKTMDRVGIIRKGRLALDTDIQALREAQAQRFRVSFDSEEAAQAFMKEDGLKILAAAHAQVDVAVQGDMAPFFLTLSRHPVKSLDKIHQTLEDLFIRYFGEEKP